MNYAQLENTIGSLIHEGELVGAELLIIENNVETFHKSFGWADRESDQKLGKTPLSLGIP